ncbi:EAL domain-containing protein [Acetohalobium arabaticum]|uniref:Diguanylate cyclase/phosphodiesterase n=1 Tax=Acetohalobium arabaticum (strain ATCC 49924 / DSM 5501 / Z-7288) TaxID=574087 RepID=D9QVY5_ACEAZ|nr:EAL domain-containing protein [Acetohalobium arabaticum]ADL12394.1 diguanylate cyclase/phosphodiesterase [Acetohalobium arabaticum DSM 5501]
MLENIKNSIKGLLDYGMNGYIRENLTDTLTDLPIIPVFHDKLHKYLKIEGKNVGVVCLDIVNFSHIEKEYGYKACEKILLGLTDILDDICDNLVRAEDKIGISNRGGDDFIIFLAGLEDTITEAEKSLQIVANRIKSQAVDRLNKRDYIEKSLNLYVGYTVISGKNVKRVESAVYKAIKEADKRAKDEEYQKWIKKKNRLAEIIDQEQIQILYQPLISLQSGEKMGYEALTRGPEGSEFERPDYLFGFAKETDLLLDLEHLCRRKSIIDATDFLDGERLSINVSPEVIEVDDFKKGVTEQLISDLEMNKKNIIFEITEKTAINNFDIFRKTLKHYYGQGYQIAVDDVGAGYANLQTISELHPQYIKLDMSLVRKVNIDTTKEALLEALINFAHRIDAKVIAEGIEDYDELEKLIELGVDYGQGYLIQHPLSTPKPIDQSLKQFILKKNEELEKSITINTLKIEKIARQDITLHQDDLVEKAVNYFEQNHYLTGIVVVNDEETPVGLIMKDELYYRLGKRFGVSLFKQRSVELIMEKHPLIVDGEETIKEVSRQAMSREHDRIYNYIVVTKEDKYYGSVSIRSLLEHITKMQVDVAQNLNPLTGLPGNSLIEQQLDKAINNNSDLAIMYIDLDNFKAFNDNYGFENGDRVIKLTADILVNLTRQGDFVGHIGGDDFIVITEAKGAKAVSQRIINRYEDEVKEIVNDKTCFLYQPTISISVEQLLS